MRCANCGGENSEGLKFCEECGSQLVRACPNCGREARLTAKFCGDCGRILPGQMAASPSVLHDVQPTQPSGLPARLVERAVPEAERRQLTVMFCDLVGSTALSAQLDPEELRVVVRTYQETCATVIGRYAGHIAQHLGDGLLVYFGYPAAHEDDAQRAVRSALGIVAALQPLSFPRIQLPNPVQVRIGIHTGVVVIGEIGSSEKREILALGETPNIAARLQALAGPDTVVISAATQRLVAGLFECQDLSPQELKGISTPVSVYRVLRESEVQSRFDAAVRTGLTPLVGRAEELALLQQRWTQAKEGAGQVVLLSGEPGIGKSRLVQALKDQLGQEDATRIEFRCSPYHQNSAFYPIIDHLQRLLQFQREETPQAKLSKLQQRLGAYRFPQTDTLPLLAALLSLPYPEGRTPLTLSPQKQKQKTQEALVAWIMEETQKAPVYCAWEDLHWADPSTLEVLTLFLEQIPTSRMFTVLTFRPEFTPPWSARSYFTQLSLSRLGQSQVEAMVEHVTGGKALRVDVLQQIVTKTDGVPLFVEEVTKSVMEAEFDVEAQRAGPLLLGIPATLQDALMARLDRLGTAKEIAQLGATLGREFTYELLHPVSLLNEETLQQSLRQLVETELVFQSGMPPQAHYLFKHALIQDTAYQSLLKSRRQQLHQQVAQVLEEKFPQTVETQPELVARHYTEAGLTGQAIAYWQQAGERAVKRSANAEAISHLAKGLELLKTLPDTPERAQQELMLQIALGSPLQATKGFGASKVVAVYTRARELCRQVGETPRLFPVLGGLCLFYFIRAELKTARELAEQYVSLAQSLQRPSALATAHQVLGDILYMFGEVTAALAHQEQVLALYNPPKRNFQVSDSPLDLRIPCLQYAAFALWHLGYPDQALKRSQEALTLAQELSHPFSLAFALQTVALLHQLRWEEQKAQECAEALITLCTEQGFSQFWALGALLQGWTLTEQGQVEAGITRLQQGLAALRTTGQENGRTHWLAELATACWKAGQTEEGLTLLAEALAFVDKTEERVWEAKLYQLKGELMLQSQVKTHKSKVEEAEICFFKAIEIARKQQAKSLELRATTSLAHLWQQQGKRAKAHQLLSEIYHWFTEGFDTKDLQEAKTLLEELA